SAREAARRRAGGRSLTFRRYSRLVFCHRTAGASIMARISGASLGAMLALMLLSTGALAPNASDPAQNAPDAAATWVGFGAAQQLFSPPAAKRPAGLTAPGGAYVAPAEADRRDPAPKPPAPANDGILRSAAPTIGVDADGRSAIVSGATIR